VRILNEKPDVPVRWFLYHTGKKGYLDVDGQFQSEPIGVLYFQGVEGNTEEEIKETFEGFTDIPLDEFECVGMYGYDEDWNWE